MVPGGHSVLQLLQLSFPSSVVALAAAPQYWQPRVYHAVTQS
jgi:hypothetical protein